MISSLFDRGPIPVLQEAVKFSEARHEVLAGNIANMDTPGYEVRDLSPEVFRERLREALAARDAGGSLGLPDHENDRELSEVAGSMKTILFHDGSNDSVEQQVLEITQNQYLHNFAVAVMKSQFNLLSAAISERA
jgi:flagellar basal-body rod protein FlgB